MRCIAKKTLAAAKQSGNDVIVQVKNNQATLLKDCQWTAARRLPDDTFQEPLTKGHNRLESRSASVYHYPFLTHLHEWGLVKAVVKIDRFRREFDTKTRQWQQSDESAYYISTIDLNAETFCRAIREHWHIENRNHHVRDVTLLEDQSRIRCNPHIFAKLRSFALNILRANQVENVSVALFDNCMKLQNVLNYFGVA